MGFDFIYLLKQHPFGLLPQDKAAVRPLFLGAIAKAVVLCSCSGDCLGFFLAPTHLLSGTWRI